MYSLLPFVFASAVLASRFPHRTRDDIAPCPGAPPVIPGAIPGDFCDGSAPSRRSLRRRNGFSTCQVVTLDQYNASPLRQTIEALATSTWGKGFTVAVNPPDQPDSPFHFCYTTDTVPATFQTPPTCSSTQSQISGNVIAGTADVTLSVNQGLTTTHQVTTDKATSLATSTQIGLTLGVPTLDNVAVQQSITLTGTFSQGETQSTNVNQQTTETVQAHATKPGPCNIQLNVTSCTGQATATVPAFYTGFVWFNYGSRKDGHFKWALNTDVIVPAEQRSDNLTLTDKVSSTNSGQFSSVCV